MDSSETYIFLPFLEVELILILFSVNLRAQKGNILCRLSHPYGTPVQINAEIERKNKLFYKIEVVLTSDSVSVPQQNLLFREASTNSKTFILSSSCFGTPLHR
jgi:hypothetical protein